MNKRQLHHQYRKIRSVKSWYFLVASLIFLAIGVQGMRQNNFEAIKLRDEVVKADEQNGNVEKALKNLQQHTYSHMNTDLSSGATSIKQPIQLKHRYEKLVSEEAQKAKTQNEQVQKAAESTCSAQFPAGGFNSARVACVAEYMRQNAAKEAVVPSELYKFDFYSPTWTPDKAGLSLLASGFLFLVFVIRLGVGWWYRYET